MMVLVVVLAVVLAFGYSPTHPGVQAVALGVGANASAGGSEALFTNDELRALSEPLPVDTRSVSVPVLMYHYVDDEPPPAGPYADGLTVRTPDFVEEMDYLVDNGYHTVTLADAYLAMAGLKELPDKPVALTFDDGGLDNYSVAFPILKERELTGTFFVITKTVGTTGQMSWAQLKEMVDAGMAVQSHSYSHPGLPGASDERLRSELVNSRASIEQQVEQPVYVLSYPAGEYDARVIEAAEAAGYVMAVATDKGARLGPDSLFEIKRTRIAAFLPLSSFARYVE
jgi:peptidoglycan/xylan/chitin deacetylase (PgdA/CDA1 family)